MRKHVVLSLTLLVVLATALAAGAADKSSASTKQYHRTHGDIASIDTVGKTFKVKHGNDTSTFGVDDSTKFRGAGKEITFADLQVGDDVRVSFTEDGTTKTAARVDVAHTKKPHS